MNTVPNPPSIRPATLAAVYFLLALVFQAETLLIPPRQDSAAWLFMAERQTHGEMPGRDLWDNKLPLIYLIGRAAHATGHSQVFLWLVEAGMTAAGALAVCGMAMRPAGRRAASIAGALLCVVSGVPTFHAGGYMTEIYAMPLSAVATWLTYTAAVRRRGTARALAAGLAWTIAVSFRLPLAVVAVVVVGYAAVTAARNRPADQRKATRIDTFVRFVMAQSAGAMAGIAIVLAHPVFAGYLPDCVAAAVAWPLGIGGGRIAGPATLAAAQRLSEWAQDLLKLGWLHIAAIAGLLVAGSGAVSCHAWNGGTSEHSSHALLEETHRRDADAPHPARHDATPAPSFIVMVTLWYTAALGSAALGWTSHAHYQYVALAPMCLAISLTATCITTPVSLRFAIVFLIVSSLAVGAMDARLLWRRLPDRRDADRTALIDYVHHHTRPDETVLVWAWSGTADLLYRLDRPPGTRHFMAHGYFNMDMRLFEEFALAFLADPPDWIVEDRQFSRPALATPTAGRRPATPVDLIRLRKFARRGYRQTATFGRYVVFRLGPTSRRP
ncbi:MAG: hypothetical protein ACE5F9_12450 [Phycisphaerae bacterium]